MRLGTKVAEVCNSLDVGCFIDQSIKEGGWVAQSADVKDCDGVMGVDWRLKWQCPVRNRVWDNLLVQQQPTDETTHCQG